MVPGSQPSGRGCQTHTGLAILCSEPAPVRLLRSLLFHLLLPLVHFLRHYHLYPALSRRASTRPSLSATSWLLARALSSFWRGPHFFWLRLRWVAPRPVYARPMRSATAVTPLPECSDSGGLPHRLLIGIVPLSPSLFFTGRSLFLTVLPHCSATWLSSFFREPRLRFNSRAPFLLRILIFFINFSPSSLDGSPSSSLSLSPCLPISLQSLGLRYLLLIPRFPSPCRRSLLRVHPRDARPTVLLANDLYVFGPLAGVALAPMSLSLREKRHSFAARPRHAF